MERHHQRGSPFPEAVFVDGFQNMVTPKEEWTYVEADENPMVKVSYIVTFMIVGMQSFSQCQ
jgi:hypothetical protein